MSTQDIRPVRDAARLAVAYMVLCYGYILASGWVVAQLAANAQQAAAMETAKGMAFIVLSGLLFFVFAKRVYERIQAREQDLLRNEAGLIAAERRAMAGTFASAVAHDMNNILMAADAVADELSARATLGGERAELAGQLVKSMQDMSALSQRLMSVGKAGLGHDFAEINLHDTIAKAVEFGRTHKRVRSCRIDIVGERELKLLASPRMLSQIVLNLLLNAADATAGHGHIEIRIARYGERGSSIEFHDDGPGVPADMVTRLFTPFLTTKPDGTGLGLLSVRSAAQQHGGDVVYAPSPLGGACFRVTLAGS